MPTPSRALPARLLTLLATAAVLAVAACFQGDPTKVPTRPPEAAAQPTDNDRTNTSVQATIEAVTLAQSIIQTKQAEPRPPTPTTEAPPLTTMLPTECDRQLQHDLVTRATTAPAQEIQNLIRQLQKRQTRCHSSIWNPVVSDPEPGAENTCLSWIDGVDPIDLPVGLLVPDSETLTPRSQRDDQGNILVHWSTSHLEKPADGARCWLYRAAQRTWTPDSAMTKQEVRIEAIALSAGDCIVLQPPKDDRPPTPTKVRCTSEWTHRTLGTFEAPPADGPYPGRDTLVSQATSACDRRSTVYLRPLEDTWLQGHRTVTCLQDSFGLSLSDPERLDTIISALNVLDEECFDEFPTTTDGIVELVPCAGTWTFRQLHSYQASAAAPHPDTAEGTADPYLNCDRRTTVPYYPPHSTVERRPQDCPLHPREHDPRTRHTTNPRPPG